MLTMWQAKPKEPWSWELVRAASLPRDLEVPRALAREAILDVLAGRPPRDARGAAIEASIMARFVRELGAMAAGWCWARDEGTFGGGVVSAWCCPRHSVPDPPGDLSAEEVEAVAERAARALGEWRDHLERVRDLVSALPAPFEPLALERSIAHITDTIAEATGCGDAWYEHALQVIGWYLERHGVARSGEIAARAIRGTWQSWVAPSPERMARTLVVLEDALADGSTSRAFDALELHRAMRIDWWDPPADVAVREDALAAAPLAGGVEDLLAPHLAAIARIDEGREPGRAERMRRALAFVAEHATGEWLSLRALQRAHGIAMGHDGGSALRTEHAYAKGGAESYGLALPGGLSVAPIGEATYGPASEVACNYLHVCFWHPFDDGNGRAARLAAAWIDLRLRVGFADLVPAFTAPRVAGDVESAWGLVRTLLASAEARRARTAHR